MSDIQFDTIPNSLRKPEVAIEFNTRLAVSTLPQNLQRVLVIGPMLDTGTAEPLTATTVYSDVQAQDYFGAGSLAAAMATAAITANRYLQLDVIGLTDSDEAGLPAAGALAIAGEPVGDGTLTVTIAGTPVTVNVHGGDKLTTIREAIVAAAAQIPSLLVTVADDAENLQLTFTATSSGEWGNDISLQASTTASGLTLTVTAMADGEINPDIQPALDAVFAAGHNILICPFTTDTALAALSDHLTATGNALEQRGALGMAGWTDSSGTGITLAAGVNDGRISMPWYRGSLKLPAVLAASYGAVVASEDDPARPLNTLELIGMDVVAMADRESRSEQETALYNGLTPIEVGPGNAVQIVRAISTYTVNSSGVADPALLDITTIRTLDYVREACRERITDRFPREKLNDSVKDQVRSELYDVLLRLEDAEIIENVEANADGLIVQRSSVDKNRLDGVIPADVVNGLDVFAGRIDLIL